ncbi:hypothetical protein GCM10010124_15350 [Pilimelia terevasa]|uniref:DUF456 domain-containing protein n=1 Tax=Pilimelia terevasa TaxID=53372 RepID=A0A8J3BS13_9ACTN|nr:DUF456 domain-containing protein [Pilimelia terevasa]GGK23792.1 hypothetical protein GCM10010124_15350 [Pilimelia terevasa]
MDETELIITVVCGLAVLAGLVGVVVPVLPGLLLSWAGVGAWAVFAAEGWQRWAVFGAVTVLALGATAAKYLWPGKQLKDSGVPNRSLFVGAALGVVGFFVVPVVGLPLGFVLGIWLAEWTRLGDRARAWPSTAEALKAAGLSMLIEFAAAMAITFVWMLGVIGRL